MGQTTITVKERTLERFNDLKDEVNDAEPDVPPSNADHFLKSLMDTWEKVVEEGYDGDVGDLEPFGGEVPEGFDSVEFKPIPDGQDTEELERRIEAVQEALDRIPERVVEELDPARYR